MTTFASEKQKLFFEKLEDAGELVLAAGIKGCVANIVGEFRVRKNQHDDDQLDMGDGTNHVHIDWSRLKRVALTEAHGEGVLIFYDGDEVLFRLFRMDGAYAPEVSAMVGALIEN